MQVENLNAIEMLSLGTSDPWQLKAQAEGYTQMCSFSGHFIDVSVFFMQQWELALLMNIKTEELLNTEALY